MRNPYLSADQVLAEAQVAALDFEVGPSDIDVYGDDRIIPGDLRQWLARLRLLEQVPFGYLVADSELLPPESIRYFHLDRGWADALVQGALSVGTVNSGDRVQLEGLHRQLRDELDEEERLVRLPGADQGRTRAQRGGAGPITGFLLRSRAVSAYPGMHVRAYRRDIGGDDEIVDEAHPDRLRLLRLERLSPAVLLAMFDGSPAVVHLEEPRVGVQFGVRLHPDDDDPNRLTATVPIRNATTGADSTATPVDVQFRPGAPGVLDLRALAGEFPAEAFHPPSTTSEMDGAEFALQMLRFPYRQVFGDPDQQTPVDAVFRPTIGYDVESLAQRFGSAGGEA